MLRQWKPSLFCKQTRELKLFAISTFCVNMYAFIGIIIIVNSRLSVKQGAENRGTERGTEQGTREPGT